MAAIPLSKIHTDFTNRKDVETIDARMSRSNLLEALNSVYIYIYMIVDAWKRVNWNGRGFSRDGEESMGPIRKAKRREASSARSLVRRRSIKL